MAPPRAPSLLGVINLSPESMVRDSVVTREKELLERAAWLEAHGCSCLDLGARSITPTAPMIDDGEEQRRLLPPLRRLRQKGYQVSVDTWSSETVKVTLAEGATTINHTGADIIRTHHPDILEALMAAETSEAP